MVVDASVVIGYLSRSDVATRAIHGINGTDLFAAPELLELEVLRWLRRRVRNKSISDRRAAQAIGALQGLRIEPQPHGPLVPLIWELRHNLSSYDASYVALAEAQDTGLLTADRGQAVVARRVLGADRVLQVSS